MSAVRWSEERIDLAAAVLPAATLFIPGMSAGLPSPRVRRARPAMGAVVSLPV